jgi:hypothetical protein
MYLPSESHFSPSARDESNYPIGLLEEKETALHTVIQHYEKKKGEE